MERVAFWTVYGQYDPYTSNIENCQKKIKPYSEDTEMAIFPHNLGYTLSPVSEITWFRDDVQMCGRCMPDPSAMPPGSLSKPSNQNVCNCTAFRFIFIRAGCSKVYNTSVSHFNEENFTVPIRISVYQGGSVHVLYYDRTKVPLSVKFIYFKIGI